MGGLWFRSKSDQGSMQPPFAGSLSRPRPRGASSLENRAASCGARTNAIGTRGPILYSYVSARNDKRTRLELVGAHATRSHDLGPGVYRTVNGGTCQTLCRIRCTDFAALPVVSSVDTPFTKKAWQTRTPKQAKKARHSNI